MMFAIFMRPLDKPESVVEALKLLLFGRLAVAYDQLSK